MSSSSTSLIWQYEFCCFDKLCGKAPTAIEPRLAGGLPVSVEPKELRNGAWYSSVMRWICAAGTRSAMQPIERAPIGLRPLRSSSSITRSIMPGISVK